MFAIPTLPALLERTRQSFRANLPGSDAWLWPNNIYVSAKVFAGSVYELFGFADYVAKQKFAITADSENLDRHGDELGLARRPAHPAQVTVTLTASGALSLIDGALFSRADDIQYRALAAAEILGAGTLNVVCVATTDGKATSAEVGTPLVIVSGVTGSATAAVGSSMLAGADVEDDDSYRERILFRKRNPPHAGAPADYVRWTLEIPGVTRVFVERDPPEVRVYPLMDDDRPNGIPTGGDVSLIASDLQTLAPATAIVSVIIPRQVALDIEIAGLSPDTTAVREAVLAELRDAFRRLSRVSGHDVVHPSMPYLASPATFSRSWIWQAVANASGEERHAIVSPAADLEVPAGSIATLGNVTFTSA